eukprot:2606970-Rhodomonas_salina.1
MPAAGVLLERLHRLHHPLLRQHPVVGGVVEEDIWREAGSPAVPYGRCRPHVRQLDEALRHQVGQLRPCNDVLQQQQVVLLHQDCVQVDVLGDLQPVLRRHAVRAAEEA